MMVTGIMFAAMKAGESSGGRRAQYVRNVSR